MSSTMGPPPSGGDYNRAYQVHAFTWTLEIISLIFVIGRMYSRLKLTHNVWWDDWCVCVAMVLDLIISVLWSVYAGRGYARHIYYLKPAQIQDALKYNTISRSMCMISIAIGKISVAFLIERFAGPSNKRKWMLRGISISVAISALITLTFFYAQCQPVQAIWDKGLIKEGKGHCWNPIPVNTWNLVIASYWAFLDFALAFIPVDIVWKLQMKKKKKFLLCMLLGMGVFAGICAAVKTSKVPITVNAKTDITWATIELLMWNGIEMNVIIIAACIPTLRPLCIVLFNRPGASQYLGSNQRNQHRSSYHKTPDSSKFKPNSNGSSSTQSQSQTKSIITSSLGGKNKVFDRATTVGSQGSTESMVRNNKNSIVVNEAIQVESREMGSRDANLDIEEGFGEEEWGQVRGSGVPLSPLGRGRGIVMGDER